MPHFVPFRLPVKDLIYDTTASATFVNSTDVILNITFNATCYTPENNITRNLYLCIPNKHLLGEVIDEQYCVRSGIELPALGEKEINVQVFKMSGKKKQSVSSESALEVRSDFLSALTSQFRDKQWVQGFHVALQFCEYERRATNAKQAHERYELLRSLKINED